LDNKTFETLTPLVVRVRHARFQVEQIESHLQGSKRAAGFRFDVRAAQGQPRNDQAEAVEHEAHPTFSIHRSASMCEDRQIDPAVPDQAFGGVLCGHRAKCANREECRKKADERGCIDVSERSEVCQIPVLQIERPDQAEAESQRFDNVTRVGL